MTDYRQKRVRLLVHKINLDRKKQAKKIDILCNDLIKAQRNFIKKIEAFRFAADFYRSIIGVGSLDRLLTTAGSFLESEIGDVNVVFFLRDGGSFHIYRPNGSKETGSRKQSFESFFTDELAAEICRNNRLCSLDEIMAMGLAVVPGMLNKLSAFVVPLLCGSSSIGFILIYRVSEELITPEQIELADYVSNGLARAIISCQPVYSKS